MRARTLRGISKSSGESRQGPGSYSLLALGVLAFCGASSHLGGSVAAQEVPAERSVTIEAYYDSREPAQEQVVATAAQFLQERPGVRLRRYDVSAASPDQEAQRSAAQRLEKIAAAARISPPRLPLFYGCNTVVTATDEATLRQHLEAALRIDVYVRAGCAHCAAAKKFIPELQLRYPGFEFRFHDIGEDRAALEGLNRLVARYRRAATSTPVFHLFNQMVVGFDGPTTTGTRLRELLDKWTAPATSPPPTQPAPPADADNKQAGPAPRDSWGQPALFLLKTRSALNKCTNVHYCGVRSRMGSSDPRPAGESAAAAQDELPLPAEIPLPESAVEPSETSSTMDLPWFGQVDLRDWGMPLFTLLVGLVDGFNPCAMWVLLFLLSILVNLRHRSRILLVAGTFVLISGLAYLAFMAAWLNVFLLIGYLRPVQICLGVIAILVGAVHVKDFFAFKQGLTLSIPEGAKPGIYQRVRAVVNAENLWGAMIGVSALAVLVNVVELLCTAGLPALYTEILTQQNYPGWLNYAYLLLYNIAYMFDDGLMVAAVVVTLGKTKLQERHGRWLKLISGLAILALGVLMLVRPDWLF